MKESEGYEKGKKVRKGRVQDGQQVLYTRFCNLSTYLTYPRNSKEHQPRHDHSIPWNGVW